MRAKNLKFTYKNVCNFIAWLTQYYRNKYQNAPMAELDGMPIDKIAQERWDSVMGNTRFILGVTGETDLANPAKKQLWLNFEEYVRDSDGDDWALSQDAEPIPAELFNQYINSCAFAG
ncbi:MAG: hypothetical protein E7011_04130 [Alphaproteobacteria bacterium]|nr:hypothetical protein [Alphaproteobacteria bacterium]